MSYPGSNPISLQPSAAPVTVQAANAPLSQHTSPYLQNNSVPLAHPSTYHHLAAHVPVSSTQTIQIQTHSQGPTPSSTPPTVPNDSKGSHPYPQRKFYCHLLVLYLRLHVSAQPDWFSPYLDAMLLLIGQNLCIPDSDAKNRISIVSISNGRISFPLLTHFPTYFGCFLSLNG